MELADKILSYENGELKENEVVELFQELVDKELIQHFEYSYQLTAKYLLLAGMVTNIKQKVA